MKQIRERLFNILFTTTVPSNEDSETAAPPNKDIKCVRSISSAFHNLDFPNRNIESFRNVKAFKLLTNLRYIDLKNNNIKELPAGIFDGLTELRRIIFDNNNIKILDLG